MSAERDPAIARFAILQLVRLSGTLLVLAGALVASRKVGWLGLPEAAGYVLMAAGLADFFALPPLLAKRWRSPNEAFLQDVTVVAEEGGFRVALDGRGIRPWAAAPDRPRRALAEAMAAEWADQGEEIDSTRFLLRDMADFALDVVAPERARTIGELLPYAETDTLCYRAEPDEPWRRASARCGNRCCPPWKRASACASTAFRA
jgi:hypothetical protein